MIDAFNLIKYNPIDFPNFSLFFTYSFISKRYRVLSQNIPLECSLTYGDIYYTLRGIIYVCTVEWDELEIVSRTLVETFVG